MDRKEYNALVQAQGQLNNLWETLGVSPECRKPLVGQYASTHLQEWCDEMDDKFGPYARMFMRQAEGLAEVIREIRGASRSLAIPSFDKKVQSAVSRCRSDLTTALYANEGRTYDWYADVNFSSLDDERLVRPDVLVQQKMHSGAWRCKFVVTPSWKTKVGSDRAVFMMNGKKAFMYDCEEFFNRSMMEAGVTCLRAKVFGIMGDSVYKHLKDRLVEEIEDATAEESGPLAHELQELTIAFKDSKPVKYELFYLEHQKLKDEFGDKVFSVGMTMAKARSLMDSRIKAHTLKALGI